MFRSFVGQVHETGDVVTIEGDDAHRILHVLRMRSGDTIAVCDSAASEFQATLEIQDASVRARLEKRLTLSTAATLELTVAQGIPKGPKMDFVVEKLTELGVRAIVPLVTERTIADASAAKHERWQRIARTAAQQTGRRDVPAIAPPEQLRSFLARGSAFDRVVIPWELADRIPLRERLPALLENVTTLAIVIGPEGGFSHGEIEAAQAAGAIPVSLGPRILRTETAALVLVGIVNYLKER